MTIEQWAAEVHKLRYVYGFRFMHAKLHALESAGVIRELCPEPNYWHYEVLKPDELPEAMKCDKPDDGYTYNAETGFRGHIIWR